MISILKPLKKRKIKLKKIYGFDVETTGQKNDFYMCSIYSDDFLKVYYNIKDLIHDLKTLNRFRNCYIVASNLQFDFMSAFKGELLNFQWLMRGSDFIYAKTYQYRGGFKHKKEKTDSHSYPITFIDTFNYARASVKELGGVIGVKKLKKPKCLGRLPKNEKERIELEEYNIRDSEISCKFIKFLFEMFIDLGAEPKYTISSVAMNLYKRNFLKDSYFRHMEDDLLEQFKAYYGGRTEAFSRGTIKDMNLYDINSLYPSVMEKKFPDPNSMRFRKHGVIEYIRGYEGISEVEIYCPDMQYPLLPYRYGNKLYFPTGTFKGYYSHVELRKALSLGYVIKGIHKQYYFKKTCRPFYEYVEFLYNERKKYKKGTLMNLSIKLLLNSLYGKFGQKFKDKAQWQPNNLNIDDLKKLKYFEIKGDFIRIKKDLKPANFCFPIWAIYVTAYGRLKIYDYIKDNEALYCDTDSIITRCKIGSSDSLGEMQFERHINNGVIVKPKFYRLDNLVKSKGIGMRLLREDFKNIINGEPVKYNKFVKLSESIRRNLVPNEVIEIEKNVGLEDDKRLWEKPFSHDELQISKPVKFKDGEIDIDTQKPKTILITT